MTKKQIKVVLSPTDHGLFNYLFLHKIAKPQQINRDVLGTVSKTSLYRRLRRLQKGGYIESVSHYPSRRPIQLFSLANKGIRTYIGNDNSDHLRMQFRSNSIIHDAQLVDIKFKFTQFKMVKEYLTENEIRSNAERAQTMLNGQH